MASLIKIFRRKKDDDDQDQGGPSVLAETIEKIALEVDYHGLADLYEASSWYARLFWSVIVIGALGAVIHDCYNIIMLFASNPSATKISEFQQKTLDLPNVTVCNMGAFNQTELRYRLSLAGEEDEQKQNDFIRYMMIMAYQTPPWKDSLKPDAVLPGRKLWGSMGLDDINQTLSFIRETAYQCPHFLIDCEFAEEPFNCCDNDIFVYTDLGGCYTLRANNQTGPVKQTGRDSASGMSITTEMDVTEIAILEDWKSVGLRLQFGDYVSPFDFSSMLHLPPGMLALVRLSPVRYVLDSSVTDCWTVEPKLTYHDGYSTGLCKHDCVLKYTVKRCGCMPNGYSTKHYEHLPTCSIEEMRTCVLPQVWNTENGSDPEEVQRCKRKNCLRMCIYWIHEPYLMLSQLKIDTNAINSTKRTNVLNVYFGYMRYTQTEAAQLMTFDTFISNLGGAIGLWTGMSLISIVQMLVYGWEGFWRLVERRRAEKMIKTMLAQHPANNANPLENKPIRIKAPMFVKPTVQFGPPQPPDQVKFGGGKKVQNMIAASQLPKKEPPPFAPTPPPQCNGVSFASKLKSVFKRNDSVQPTGPSQIEILPPDPKPRPASVGEISQESISQSIGPLFDKSATIENVGSGAPIEPWTTIIDEDTPKKEKGKDISYSNPVMFSHENSLDESWTTADTSVAESIESKGQGGKVGSKAQNQNAKNSQAARKRTQSEHRQKRHPLSRPRY